MTRSIEEMNGTAILDQDCLVGSACFDFKAMKQSTFKPICQEMFQSRRVKFGKEENTLANKTTRMFAAFGLPRATERVRAPSRRNRERSGEGADTDTETDSGALSIRRRSSVGREEKM